MPWLIIGFTMANGLLFLNQKKYTSLELTFLFVVVFHVIKSLLLVRLCSFPGLNEAAAVVSNSNSSICSNEAVSVPC